MNRSLSLVTCALLAIVASTEHLVAEGVDSAAKFNQRGNDLFKARDFDAAIRAFSMAIKLDPNYAQAFSSRGSTYGAKRDLEKAIADCTRAIRLDPTLVLAFDNRGSAYALKGEYARAVADFNEAIRLDPKNSQAFLNRGVALGQIGQVDRGIADCSAAIDLKRGCAEAFFNRGCIYDQKADREKAIVDYSTAIRLDPKYTEAYCNRGYDYHAKGEFDSAIADYTQTIHLMPKLADAYYGRGCSYFAKGEDEDAIADYSKAIRLKPGDSDAYLARGMAYDRDGERGKAIADYSEVVRLDRKSVRARCYRAISYDERGNRVEALSDLDEAVRVAPESSLSRTLRGCVRVKSGDYDGGLADLRAGIALDPADPAGKFEDWAKTPVSAEAIRFGEQQVRNMLRDRPAMSQYGQKAEPLRRWAARKFAGEDLKERIRWDSTEPPILEADNSGPISSGTLPRIRLSETYYEGEKKGQKKTGEDLWCSAVFELYNITASDEFRRLYAEAAAERVAKKAYVATMVEIEVRATDRTRAFYVNVFLPWAKDHRVPSDPRQWYVDSRPDTQEKIAWFVTDRKSRYPTVYENGYDYLVLRSLVKKQENKRAISFASSILPRAFTNEEAARICVLRAMARLREGDTDTAILDIDESIRLNPKDPLAYVKRARAYGVKREYDKSIADADESIRTNTFADCDTNAEALCLRGCAYGHKRDFDRAIVDLNEAIRLDQNSSEAYSYRSSVYKEKGETSKAEADSKRARELDAKP